MPDPLLDPVYRLEVYVDGQLHRWQQHEAEASTVVRHEGVPVSWPHRRTVQIPDGLVTLRIAASSIGQVPCFVRVRQIEDDFYAVESRD